MIFTMRDNGKEPCSSTPTIARDDNLATSGMDCRLFSAKSPYCQSMLRAHVDTPQLAFPLEKLTFVQTRP